MDKNISTFNPFAQHTAFIDTPQHMKSEINGLEYALSQNAAYVASNPNLAKTFQERYPKLGIKEVKIPDSFLRCLIHICKSSNAKSHFFNFNYNSITIADTGKEDLSVIFRTGSKFNFNKMASLYVAYHDALMKKGFFKDPKSYDSCNIIDASAFFKTILNNLNGAEEIENSIRNYVSSNPFYAYLPCFNDGVLKMSNVTYCHWKVNSVDAENKTLSISMYLYYNEHSSFTPFAEFSATLEFPEHLTKKVGFTLTHTTYTSLYEILHAITPKQMKWVATDRKAWMLFIKFGKMVDAISIDGDCVYDAVQENIFIIMWCFAYINSVLHSNKRHYKARQKKTDETKVVKSFNPEKQREKKLHILSNLVSITSDEPPKEMTKCTSVKYHLASWTVKGHVRHYKSGKIAYVRPHTKRRKGMEKEAETTTPRTQKVVLNTSHDDKI